MQSSAKGKTKTKTRIVTTYLPPELAAELDALVAAEGGSRSGWLRAAVETCLTDLEWLRATGFPQRVAQERDLDLTVVAERIAANRAKAGPAPLRASPRLEGLVNQEGSATPSTNGNIPAAGGRKPLAFAVCLGPELAADLESLAREEKVSQSALLRGSFEKYLANRALEAMIAENERQAAALGLTPDEVQRLINEYRAERRQSA